MECWVFVCFHSLVFLALDVLEAAGVKSTISPSYVWPLRYIYNRTVPVVPPLAVHGDVSKHDNSLQFDGKTSWLDAGELPGSCISQPQSCVNGLSVAVRVRLENSPKSATPRFLFDSGGFNGEGVSLYITNEQLIGQVADKKRVWKVSSQLSGDAWHFVLLTWSANEGLFLFIDGPITGQSSQPVTFQLQPVATSKHVMIGKCNAESETSFASFASDLVAVFDSITPDGKVYLSYTFSAPTTRGNIRYVNAKFINSADFDLIIFPDRGEHQLTGYQLEARSSTLLEYVLREGPLPIGMNFRLQNKKNGEQLSLDGKDNIHVVSSDDKQVVNGYKIQPDASIKLMTSTSGVSINYEIRPAQTTPVKPTVPTRPGAVQQEQKPEPTSSEASNLLTDNPESPEDKENGTTTIILPTSPPSKLLPNRTEATSTAKPTKTPLKPVSTIPPTVPPPPEASSFSKPPVTKTPGSANESNINETARPTQPGSLIPPAGPNSTEASSNYTEPSSNATKLVPSTVSTGSNETVYNISEPNVGSSSQIGSGNNITKAVTNVTEPSSNTTMPLKESNQTTLKPGEKISSPEMPEEEEQFAGIEVTNNTTLNASRGGDLEVSAENVTESGQTAGNQPIGNKTIENLTNASSLNESTGNLTNANLLNETMGNLTNGNASLNTTEQNPPTAPISPNSNPNPWLNIAKQVQDQQVKPIPWENGQGAYDAIHSILRAQPQEKQSGLAPINYNLDSASRQNNKPVWQFINGRPVTGEWFGESQHLTEQQNPGTSPFKFANPRTQEQAKAFYFDNNPTSTSNNGIENDQQKFAKTPNEKEQRPLL